MKYGNISHAQLKTYYVLIMFDFEVTLTFSKILCNYSLRMRYSLTWEGPQQEQQLLLLTVTNFRLTLRRIILELKSYLELQYLQPQRKMFQKNFRFHVKQSTMVFIIIAKVLFWKKTVHKVLISAVLRFSCIAIVIINNQGSFCLWQSQYLVKYQNVSKIMTKKIVSKIFFCLLCFFSQLLIDFIFLKNYPRPNLKVFYSKIGPQ